MTTPAAPTVDSLGPWRAQRAPAPLGVFAQATVLDAADVHVATTLCRLAGDDDPDVALAIGLAVRAVRLGSVTVDLDTIATTVAVDEGADVDVGALPWPDPLAWQDAVRRSPLVAEGDEAPDRDADGRVRPLRLLGPRLALDRYWRHERAIAADLRARAGRSVSAVDEALLRSGLDRLFDDDPPDLQRVSAAAAVLEAFSVVAGGPGTGKTTTVAAVLALLHDQAAATGSTLRVALAAPTGKAAARLTEAVHAGARRLDLDAATREAVLATEASTIHRLLGRSPGSNSRFRHDRSNQLPHQVVIVDETSMVSLSLMARLVEAVRPGARLVLVGDPQQLASVEAGAVLGDIVGPAADGFRGSADAVARLEQVTGHTITSAAGTTGPGPDTGIDAGIGDGIVVLRTVHRYTGGIGRLARDVEAGDADGVVATLRAGLDDVTWLDADADPNRSGGAGRAAAEAIREQVTPAAVDVVRAAAVGDATGAIESMRRVQVLCAHRRGPHGVSVWRQSIERWLVDAVPGHAPRGWYAGRPLLVTENDYSLGLFNGDSGVVVDAGDGRLACAFERRGEVVLVAPGRLRAVETLHAMTIHKSQGSQFGEVVVVLPDESSPILTRELLYTAVTRAERAVTVVGTEAAVRAAVDRPVQRASGLRERLWRT